MLEYLRIRDLALIADMELDFSAGMNVLTGETGAGKSFILKALNFLMGERLGAEMVRQGSERALVEALFSTPSGESVIRRELLDSGRSRLYLNDKLCSQETIRELRSTLLVHTSQHGQQKLLQPAFQNTLLDDWLGLAPVLSQRDELLKKVREVLLEKENLDKRFHSLSERRELLEIHLAEIDKVHPEPGEEEQLEAMRAELRGGESVRKQYARVRQVLRGEENGLFELLGQLEHALSPLHTDEECAAVLESTAGFRQQLLELDQKLRHPPVISIDADPDTIEARLFELAQLKRKLHRTLPDILALKEEIVENLSFLDACTLDIRQIEKKELQYRKQLKAVLSELSEKRRKGAEAFTEKLQTELVNLGFSSQLKVAIEFSQYTHFPDCLEDRPHFLWAPNPGQPPLPLDRIASGGELSRFMLAVISVQNGREDATLIFDEVDSGVGGLTLNKVADRLAGLAATRQMLVITHWPQLATRATRHFLVTKTIEKNQTFTRCSPLRNAEIQTELERMAGIMPS